MRIDRPAVVRLVAEIPTHSEETFRIPLLAFADRLAHKIDGGRSIDLHRWIDRVGEAVGMSQNEQIGRAHV